MSQELLTKLDSLHEANTHLQGQCLRYEAEITEITSKENSYAKKLSPKDKEAIVAKIDMIVSKIDTLSGTNGVHSH
jgi:hypothetical protein